MRLLIVANRLPITLVENQDKISIHESSGGLVSSIGSYVKGLGKDLYSKDSYLWVGWPGGDYPKDKKNQVQTIFEKANSYPVYLNPMQVDDFYLGFCNKILWPLFHYFPTYCEFSEPYWESYKEVNELFLEKVLKNYRHDDIVLIQDYHFMLLPQMLRRVKPKATIGFFLHTPFPSFEIFRLLPKTWREAILEGLLGSDLIGFHTQDYTDHFLRCVSRILGQEHQLGRLSWKERVVETSVLPIGINFNKFHTSFKQPKVKKEEKKLKKLIGDRKTIFSLDRLDYTKGLKQRLEGFELFLKKHPSFHKKVTLVMVVIPSRQNIPQYFQIKQDIELLISKINGQFGDLDWTPINYLYRSLTEEELTALYDLADISLVTPLRDGMNLVAKEFIAAKRKTGVLILSEFAGSAQELKEATIVNPNSITEIAEAIYESLQMSPSKQKEKLALMQARLKHYDVKHWAVEFIDQLMAVRKDQPKFSNVQDERNLISVHQKYQRSSSRLFLIDYDGTLAPFYSHPSLAQLPAKTASILKKLTKDKRNTVYIVSGRDRPSLDKWFSALRVGLIAEHGAFIKDFSEDWQFLHTIERSWKEKIRPFFEKARDRLPESFIEEKEFSIVWHYRDSDPKIGEVVSLELADDLKSLTSNMNLQVLLEHKVVEIKSSSVSKATVGYHLLNKSGYEFIFSIGDGKADEDLFAMLPPKAITVSVGQQQSSAKYYLTDQKEVIKILESFV